ncbi:MAG: hypothetical protein K0T01_3039 [Acidimicrobiia bacterium]|nr:hypothetical protein [Acidimicrobiia bacterium]
MRIGVSPQIDAAGGPEIRVIEIPRRAEQGPTNVRSPMGIVSAGQILRHLRRPRTAAKFGGDRAAFEPRQAEGPHVAAVGMGHPTLG